MSDLKFYITRSETDVNVVNKSTLPAWPKYKHYFYLMPSIKFITNQSMHRPMPIDTESLMPDHTKSWTRLLFTNKILCYYIEQNVILN